MMNFYRIADNTFKESIREPIFFLLLLTALILIGHFPSMALFVFSEQIKLVVDSSMATSLIFGLFAAVLCASHTVSREMRNGTVLLLMSKPVSHASFILAKIAGIVVAVVLFVALCNMASVISIYIAVDQFRMDMQAYFLFCGAIALGCAVGMMFNFWRGSSFPAAATIALTVIMPCFLVYCYMTKEHPTLSLKDLAAALTVIFFAVSAMATLAVIFAVFVDVVANLTICSLIFFLGLVSSYLFQNDTGSEILNVFCSVMYAVIPNWQFFWLADAIAARRAIPWSYVWQCGLYVVLYMILAGAWGVAVFRNREVARSSR